MIGRSCLNACAYSTFRPHPYWNNISCGIDSFSGDRTCGKKTEQKDSVDVISKSVVGVILRSGVSVSDSPATQPRRLLQAPPPFVARYIGQFRHLPRLPLSRRDCVTH